MSGDQVEEVRRWLAGEGYPLEYKTARVFTAQGFEVFQGIYFGDKDGAVAKSREIDVLATWDRLDPDAKRPVRAAVQLALECKNNSRAWVVLKGSQRRQGRWEAAPFAMFRMLRWAEVLGSAEDQPGVSWFCDLPPRVGHTAVQAFHKGGDLDPAHGALTSVVKAARASLGTGRAAFPVLALPVIVLAGGLYSLQYEEDGTESLVPSGWERILWRGSGSGEPVVVDLVQADELTPYAKAAAQGAEELVPVMWRAFEEARRTGALGERGL